MKVEGTHSVIKVKPRLKNKSDPFYTFYKKMKSEPSKNTQPCAYNRHGIQCKRDSETTKTKYCIFHELAGKENSKPTINEKFYKAINQLINNSDGDWDGFTFPDNFTINKENFCSEINFPISARHAFFQNLIIDNVTFNKSVNFEESVFDSVEIGSAKFKEGVDFKNTKFNNSVNISQIRVAKNVSFHKSIFKSDFIITGEISGTATFNSAIFNKSATFSGVRNISLFLNDSVIMSNVSPEASFYSSSPKDNNKLSLYSLLNKAKEIYRDAKNLLILTAENFKNYFSNIATHAKLKYQNVRQKFPFKDDSTEVLSLFHGETHFQSVSFNDPKNTIFKDVDLRQTRFLGTDVRDIKFIGANWYQRALKRNGLFDEVWINSVDYNTKQRVFPQLEYTYRYIRISLESVKDYLSASDFYVGEMEVARKKQCYILKRNIFSILAIYNLISRYGTSPFRALLMFSFFTAMHSLFINQLISTGYKKHGFYTLLYSIQIMTIQRGEKIIKIASDHENILSIHSVNIIFSLIGPALLTMFILSFRGKIKRY